MDIRNKVALVTGAAVGIGRAISEWLANAGAAVVLTDINAREGAETLRRIQQACGRAAFRVGAIFIWTSSTKRRIGDRVAHTIVVRRS